MKVLTSLVLFLYASILFSEVDGRAFYFKECQKCHRKEGRHAGIITDVAGKNVDHLFKELMRFKNGQRVPAIFAPIKKTMTNEETKAVSEYMSTM